MSIQATGSGVSAAVYENGVRVFPCRCGRTHAGMYAAEEFAHHNCFHASPLSWLVGPADTPKQVDWALVCPDCGEVFEIAV